MERHGEQEVEFKWGPGSSQATDQLGTPDLEVSSYLLKVAPILSFSCPADTDQNLTIKSKAHLKKIKDSREMWLPVYPIKSVSFFFHRDPKQQNHDDVQIN